MKKFQRGGIITLRAHIALLKLLREKYGLNYLKCCATNQDYLERLFGVLRAMGGCSTTPTAKQILHLLGRYVGGIIGKDKGFDLFSKRAEVEECLEIDPYIEKSADEIETLLSEDIFNALLDNENDSFHAIASFVASKLKFTHPELGSANGETSSNQTSKFSNIFNQG